MLPPRYAIYFVPDRKTALYQFGASVLGYDCYSGDELPLISGVDANAWLETVQEPRVYGFHATLKAPFRLADGRSEVDLIQAVQTFAGAHAPVHVGALSMREIGSFIALVPDAACPPLDLLAEACVRDFDHFRAPMTATDRERRLAAGLNAPQIAYLDQWGYPYVFEAFRFHMTLTGALAARERASTFQFLCDRFMQIPEAHALTLDQIVVTRQDDKGSRLQVIEIAPLGRSLA
jgi:putative phosphonate metabolism protein